MSYRENGRVMINELRREFPELDSLPFPDREHLPNHLYSNVKFMGPATGKFTCISVTRGCPFRCKYCASAGQWNGLWRIRSVDNVLQEITQLYEEYGVRVLRFNDDLLTWKRKWMAEFCEKLSASKMKLKWYCDARVETVNWEMLKMMKKAGCRGVQYGIEFGNERIRRAAGKKFTSERAFKAIELTRKAGIEVFGLFMIGYPGEDESTVMETIDFAVKSRANWAGFSVVTPFPGTELYDYCKENNLLKSDNWEDYNIDSNKSVIKLEHLSDEKLAELLELAYKKFYFRFGYILYRLFHLASLHDFISAFALVKKVFLPKRRARVCSEA